MRPNPALLFVLISILSCGGESPGPQVTESVSVSVESIQTPHGSERFANGHTLIVDGGAIGRGAQRGDSRSGAYLDSEDQGTSKVIEVDEKGEVIWYFDQGLGWAHDADRLPNGDTLIADTGRDRIIEVNAAGQLVWSSEEIALSDGTVLSYPNDIDPLQGDTLLITDRDNHRVIEIDRMGKILWQIGVTGTSGDDDAHLQLPHNADRLPDGHTLLADSGNDRIVEVNGAGAVVWKYEPAGNERLRFPKDADRLQNGNTLITDSHNARIVEVTSHGTVVWQYSQGLDTPYDADRLSTGTTLISGTSDGRVIEVDPAGTIVWDYPARNEGIPPPATRYLAISYNANYQWGPPDHIGVATAEEFVSTLNRHLDLMERLGLTADYYFTGLAAEKLAAWSPDTIRKLVASCFGVNYHGANRPPYPQLVEQVTGEDWEQDVATAHEYEIEGRNPATGEYVGGITAFRSAFGLDPLSTGRFFEASILAVDKEAGCRMGVGLMENTGATRNDAWFLGVLNRPEQTGLSASALVEAAIQHRPEEYLSRVRTLAVEAERGFPLASFPIHDHDLFGHDPEQQEEVWLLYEQTLRLLQDLGFRFITVHELAGMVRNGPAPALDRDETLEAAGVLIRTMGSTGYPPEYVTTRSGVSYSLAECFEALTLSLTAYQQYGSLPPNPVRTRDLQGPTEFYTSRVPTTNLAPESVLDAAVAMCESLSDRIPERVALLDWAANPAEFLYVLAQVYVELVRGAPALVKMRPVSILPLAVIGNEEADPLTRLQFWTYKPAVFAFGDMESGGR